MPLKCRSFVRGMAPGGVEPPPTDWKSAALSTELRGLGPVAAAGGRSTPPLGFALSRSCATSTCTMVGSSSAPARRISSSIASSSVSGARYGRSASSRRRHRTADDPCRERMSRRRARRGSRFRPSARATSARSATLRKAGDARRIRSPTIVCWRTIAHSRSSSGPGFAGSRPGQPASRGRGAARRARGPRARRGVARASPDLRPSRPTPSSCAWSSGSRTESASRSAPSSGRVSPWRECFCAYRRSSTICSALGRVVASSGSTTAPNEVPISNPSPCSVRPRTHGRSSARLHPRRRRDETQNSSPPSRYASPSAPGRSASRRGV